MFHHGAYLGHDRLIAKFAKHSHREANNESYFEKIRSVGYDFVPTTALPINIQQGTWPSEFFGDPEY